MKAFEEFVKRQMRLLFAILIFSVGHIALATAADTSATHKKALFLVSVKFGGLGLPDFFKPLIPGKRLRGCATPRVAVV